jgi:hypothetical protein
MTDIFHDWKTNRFVKVAADEYNVRCIHLIVLTDIHFWVEHIEELVAWCSEMGCLHQGMTVEIPTDELLTAFYLKWL